MQSSGHPGERVRCVLLEVLRKQSFYYFKPYVFMIAFMDQSSTAIRVNNRRGNCAFLVFLSFGSLALKTKNQYKLCLSNQYYLQQKLEPTLKKLPKGDLS
jgi:hypothetical protein